MPSGALFAAGEPVAGHLLEGFAFGFGHEAAYEPCGEDTDYAIEGVGEHVAEAFAHRTELHVVHRYEC